MFYVNRLLGHVNNILLTYDWSCVSDATASVDAAVACLNAIVQDAMEHVISRDSIKKSKFRHWFFWLVVNSSLCRNGLALREVLAACFTTIRCLLVSLQVSQASSFD
jgi:hypothetical protein